jgi:hypothetical protein
MDKELKKIEERLERLKPSNLESDFYQKINGIFDSSVDGADYESKNKIIIFSVFLQRIAAAAAILIACIGMFFAFLNDSNRNNLESSSNNNIVKTNKENDNKFVPIKTKNTFEGVSRDEIFISKDRIPYQPLKYQFSDSFIWENKTDGSVIELNIPSQRFFYVPIKTD